MAKLIRTLAALMLGLALPAAAVQAAGPLSGTHRLALVDNRGQAHPIGRITFAPAGAGIGYRLRLDEGVFTDHFLSMKEMKCLEGDELWCHIPYPYANPHRVAADDLRWLEHDLLFLFKRPGEFGANFWNGIYYRLRIEGDVIRGEARAVDLNLLASPPADPAEPPIGEVDLEQADRLKRWLPALEIR